MINMKYQGSFFYHIVSIAAVIFSAMNIFLHITTAAKVDQWILSVVFSVGLLISINFRKNSNNYSMIVLLIVMFFRYCIMPFSYYVTGIVGLKYLINSYTEYAPTALVLMVYELIVVLLIINWLAKKYLSEDEICFDNGSELMHVGNFLIIIALIGVLIIFPQFFSHLFVFSFEDNTGVTTGSSINGLYVIIYRVGLIALYCVLIRYLSRNNTNFIKAAVVTAVFMWISSQSASGHISRTVIIVNGISLLMILAKEYPDKIKLIFGVGATLVAFIMVLGTMIRFSFTTAGGLQASLNNTFTSVFDYGSLCSYFGGVENVSTSLAMINNYRSSIGLSTFFNDVFYSFPFLGSRFTDMGNITPLYFNITYHGYSDNISQIVPYIGQGVAYLGYVFAPLFSAAVVAFSIICNKKMKRARSEFEYYLWAMGVYYGATFTMYNINIFFTHVTNRMLPVLILILLNRKRFVIGRKV